jgi:predicted nucleic acid-binding protein
MPPIVIDASAIVPTLLSSELTPMARTVSAEFVGRSLLAPSHLPIECLNALVTAGRVGVITRDEIVQRLGLLFELPIQYEAVPDRDRSSAAVEVAARHRLSAYDAAYLELAVRTEAGLASFDKKLRRAAVAENVPLLPEQL